MKRAHSLAEYSKRRRRSVTPEPPARVATTGGDRFVVQKHAARRLHYYFRLELDGVLKSWAIPKGPSLVLGEKRLAVEVEDHPVDYADFEGTIPRGQYGGGEVIVWDRGSWSAVGDPHEGLKRGRLSFVLDGNRLRGKWALVRIRGRRGNGSDDSRPSWLLMKSEDEFANDAGGAEITDAETDSVISGRTIEDLASGAAPHNRARKAHRAASEKRTSASRSKRARMPHDLEQQLATLVDRPPRDGGWIFEIKVDGYRALAYVNDGDVHLVSRGGQDWTERFPTIARALERLRVKSAVFDGEICFLADDGKTDFQKLQNSLKSADATHLAFIVFDLLYRDGEDLRSLQLAERKAALRTILAGEKLPLRYSDHVDGEGERLFSEACRRGLEGIIGKRADPPYSAGRSKAWIKVKCSKRDEFVVVGFTPPKGKRVGLGALIVATKTRGGPGESLRFAGKVGTGFTGATLVDLEKRLRPLARSSPPVPVPRGAGVRDATWVRPSVVCDIGFTETTADGRLRHPVFMGLREDKPASEVVRERPVRREALESRGGAQARRSSKSPPARGQSGGPQPNTAGTVLGVTITHANRVIDQASRVTKGDLAAYYAFVAKRLLAHASKRPLALVRCPEGVDGACFFQKHAPPGLGREVHRDRMGKHRVLDVDSPEGLAVLAQFGVVELHGWGSQLPDWQTPDSVVFDIDPDEALPFSRAVGAAQKTKKLLDDLGLRSFVKTTGGKGLHVVAPIVPKASFAEVRAFARSVAEALVASDPESFVATASKKDRRGKVFIDYLRNGEGATSVLPYSARARAGLPVAMPIAWSELSKVDPAAFNVQTVPRILSESGPDPWREYFRTKQPLPDMSRLAAT